MFRSGIIVGVVLVTLLAGLPISYAQDDDDTGMCQGIVLIDGWIRPSVSTTTAIYGKFINLGSEDDMLMSITSDIAPTIELHESSMTEDMMEMRPVEGGIPLLAQDMISLEAGGLHGMVIGLTDFLEAGQIVTVEFEFMQTGRFEVELTVGDPAEFDTEEPPQAIVLNGDNCTDTVGFYGAWSRPGVEGGTSAIYGVLLNLSEEDQILVSASTDITETAELHESMMMDDGTMMIQPVENGIVISAGSYTILQPGGLHIMLIDLLETLDEEGNIDVILIFDKTTEINLVVPIRSMMVDMDNMNMMH